MNDRTTPLDHSDPPDGADRPAAVAVVCEAGPAAGVARALGPGRHVIGRAVSAAFRVADRAIEPHHAVLEVGTAGDVRLHQLAGRVPCRVDGAPVGTGPEGSPVAAGAIVTVGASRLRVDVDRLPAALADDGPDPVPAAGDLDVGQVTVPSERGGRTGAGPDRGVPGVLGVTVAVATIGAGGIVGVAAGARRWGAPLVLVTVVVAAAVLAGRRRRDDRAVRDARLRAQLVELERDLAALRTRWLAARRLRAPSVAEVAARLEDASDERGGRDVAGAPFVVSLGEGPDRWEPPPATDDGAPASTGALAVLGRLAPIERAPVECALGAGASLTISGPGAIGVARAVVIQLAASAAPEQMRLDLDGLDGLGGLDGLDGLDGGSWTADLPHTLSSPPGAGRHVVVFVDRADLVARPPGAIREALELDRDAALVVVDEGGLAARSGVGARLDLGESGMGRWRPDAAAVGAREVAPAGIDAETAGSLAARIADRARTMPATASPRCPRRPRP